MDTQAFLNELQTLDPASSLRFQYGDQTVRPGYHVTEIMNVLHESVDCGGQANTWRETVVQLQGQRADDRADDAPAFMTVGKFLGIYERVTQSLAVQAEAELRLEYGDPASPALRYHVTAVEADDAAVTVSLTPPGVTCKARDRAQTGSTEADMAVLEVASGQKACC
ncbi:DUF6428 family protein [soil metagenome]